MSSDIEIGLVNWSVKWYGRVMAVVSETMWPVDIHELFGAGIRAARERRGWTQEDAARWFRFNGLATWRRSTVAEVEAGRRRPSVGDLLLACIALRVTFADLVPDVDERVDLGAGATMTVAEVRALLSADWEAVENLPLAEAHSVPGAAWVKRVVGPAVAELEAEMKRLQLLLEPIAAASSRQLVAADEDRALTTPSEAEARGAVRLGVEPAQLKLASHVLWGRAFEEERNARAAMSGDVPAATMQARRGHVARAMLGELKIFLESAYSGDES